MKGTARVTIGVPEKPWFDYACIEAVQRFAEHDWLKHPTEVKLENLLHIKKDFS